MGIAEGWSERVAEKLHADAGTAHFKRQTRAEAQRQQGCWEDHAGGAGAIEGAEGDISTIEHTEGVKESYQ